MAPVARPPSIRFWSLVTKTETCWLWTGGKTSKGYGNFWISDSVPNKLAHRYAYEEVVGDIASGLVLDHLCRVRHCVRPDHLEPVTCRENLLRGDTFNARNMRTTHCPAGHEYNKENTHYYTPKRKNTILRVCRACKRESARASHLKPDPSVEATKE